MHLPAVAGGQDELPGHVLALVVRVARSGPHPHELRRHVARVRVGDQAHADLGVSDQSLVERFHDPQLGPLNVPAGRGLPGLVVDHAAVGREGLDPRLVLRESICPQLPEHVFRRVPIPARSLDPVVAGDLDHVVLRDLPAQSLVQEITPAGVEKRRGVLGTAGTAAATRNENAMRAMTCLPIVPPRGFNGAYGIRLGLSATAPSRVDAEARLGAPCRRAHRRYSASAPRA